METIDRLLNTCKRVRMLDEIIEISPKSIIPSYINMMNIELDLLDKNLVAIELTINDFTENNDPNVANMDIFRLKREIMRLKNELGLRYKDSIT